MSGSSSTPVGMDIVPGGGATRPSSGSGESHSWTPSDIQSIHTPNAKAKLDELLFHWLSLPDTQELVGDYLDGRRELPLADDPASAEGLSSSPKRLLYVTTSPCAIVQDAPPRSPTRSPNPTPSPVSTGS
jgi:hypothetical protein